MKITFKDVGQGDSILLEWNEDGKDKIAVIDCNKKDKVNPILEHIKLIGYQEIEFIILSHPHMDHYSGMAELLEYMEENNIIVKNFAHTLHFLGTDLYRYLNSVEIDTHAMIELQKLFNQVGKMKDAQAIKKVSYLSENVVIPIANGITMKCLSPSASEAEKYMAIVDLEPFKNKRDASKGANYLSTMFKISGAKDYCLLTSDSEITTFERIVKEDVHVNLREKSLRMCQLPHHGAEHNYHPPFWAFITRGDKPDAVASAGLNEKYKHPHIAVLNGFYKDGYAIHATNIVYGMIEFAETLKTFQKVSNKLDVFTDLVSSPSGGDKSFELS